MVGHPRRPPARAAADAGAITVRWGAPLQWRVMLKQVSSVDRMSHKGWHSRNYLPHFDSQDVIQFVTFRLADSLQPRRFSVLGMQIGQRLCATSCSIEGGARVG